ncbi:MAG: DUF3488 and transglutaminase-like domain-containing protein, partial [Chromatiales bacterium]|nr:DUF3488 and transglutaminase-like domain-containing protein [Chromatiales bacterium]
MKGYESSLTPSYTGRLWLLFSLFTVLIPHFTHLPLPLIAICLATFLWRLLHEIKGLSLPTSALRVVFTIVGFFSVILLFKTFIGRDAGVALLTLMISLKLLEMRSLRDALITLYLGYFLVIGAFLFDQSIYMGLYLLLVVWLLTTSLIILNHPDSRFSSSRLHLRYAGRLLLQSLPVMVVMFLLFPRLNAPLWSMPHSNTAKSGLSDQIRMGTISSLVESEEVAFRVEFNGPVPDADRLYWRGPVLWYTDGRTWQRLRQTALHAIPEYEAYSDSVDYTITLEANGYSWLFSLDLPALIPNDFDFQAFTLPDYQLLAAKPITTKQRYQLQSVLDYHANTLTESHRIAGLQLPDAINPLTVNLAQSWINEGLAPEEIIERALSFFIANDFYYTRKPPLLADDPVDDFLFNTRRGFCEHYATSFVTLMRAAGIPARVVTGYQGGELNDLGDYLIVRQSSAHAWSEVWLYETGWMRIDPTSTIPIERVEDVVDTQRFVTTDLINTVASSQHFSGFRRSFLQLRQMWDSMNHGWNQWVLGFDRQQQDKLLRALGIKDMSWQNLLLILVASMIFLVLSITLFILIKRPRLRDPVQQHYLKFCH